jgi:predicted nucleotidyltransferase
LAGICEYWKVTRLELLPTAVTGTADVADNLQVLASFKELSQWNFEDLFALQSDLKGLFGLNVDVIDHVAVSKSRNPLRRKAIASAVGVIYDAA